MKTRRAVGRQLGSIASEWESYAQRGARLSVGLPWRGLWGLLGGKAGRARFPVMKRGGV